MKEENGMTATPVEPIVSPFYDRERDHDLQRRLPGRVTNVGEV
jgi:hypothetical protein